MCAESFQDTSRLLTVRQAAQLLNVSVSTLYGWVWQRQIPFVKLGRCLRFDLRELEGFIRTNRRTPSPHPTIVGRSRTVQSEPKSRTRARMPRAAGKG